MQRHGIPVEEQAVEHGRPESAGNGCGANSNLFLTQRSRRAWGSMAHARRNSATSDKLANLVADVSPCVAARVRHRSFADKPENGTELDLQPDSSADSTPCARSTLNTFSAVAPPDTKWARSEPTSKIDAVRARATLTSALDIVSNSDSEEEGEIQEDDVMPESSFPKKIATEPLDLRRGVARLLRRAGPPRIKHGLPSCSVADSSEEISQPQCPGKLPGITKRQPSAIDAPAPAARAPQSIQHLVACEEAGSSPSRRLSTGSVKSSTLGELQIKYASHDGQRRNSCPSANFSDNGFRSKPAAISVCDAHEQQTNTLAVSGQGQSQPGTPHSVQQPASPSANQARPGSLRRTKYLSSIG